MGEALEEADGDRVSVFTVGADDPDADAERGGEADGAAVWVADRDLLADGDALAVAVRVAVASAEAAAAVCEPDEDGVAVKLKPLQRVSPVEASSEAPYAHASTGLPVVAPGTLRTPSSRPAASSSETVDWRRSPKPGRG